MSCLLLTLEIFSLPIRLISSSLLCDGVLFTPCSGGSLFLLFAATQLLDLVRGV